MTGLPTPRGPLSEALVAVLRGETSRVTVDAYPPDARADDDLQLALYLCYELHYGGIEGVAEDLEWSPELIRFRGALESRFETSVRGAVADVVTTPVTADAPLARIIGRLIEDDDGPSVATALAHEPQVDRYREFLLHRSAYHLKEADPFTWGIPRLTGRAKAAMVQIQADEYGGGDHRWMHSALFADTMRSLGLDPAAGPPLDLLPGCTLATVNLISLFGLHRRLRGALVGHLAVFEMTSCIPNRRYGDGLRRLGFGEEATRFFDEHVEADAVHGAIAADDMAGGLVGAEPALLGDVVFGAAAALVTERRWSEHVLARWAEGRSSLEGSPAHATG